MKNKGKAHTSQDVLVIGSVYVITYWICLEVVDLGKKARFAVKDPVIIETCVGMGTKFIPAVFLF